MTRTREEQLTSREDVSHLTDNRCGFRAPPQTHRNSGAKHLSKSISSNNMVHEKYARALDKHTCRKSINMRQMLMNFPRVPSSDSVVVSDIKNMIAKIVCFIETIIADMRFMLIIGTTSAWRATPGHMFLMSFVGVIKGIVAESCQASTMQQQHQQH
jgi:hypothetical protein